MLHQEAGAGDAQPAAGTHEDGLSTGLHQLDDVRVEANGRHGQDNEELGELLEGLEEAGIHTRHGGNCGDDGGQDKEEDEEGEDLLDVKGTAGSTAAPLGLPGAPEGQYQRDGDDGQGAGKLDDGGVFQHRAVGAVEGVPGGSRRRDGGCVVNGRSGEEAEALVAHTHGAAQSGEKQGCQDIEEENDGDGLGDLLVVRTNNGSGGSDGGAAADGGSHAHQHGDIAGDLHPLAQQERDHQGHGDGGADNGQGLGTHLGDLRKVQTKAQEDHCILQDLLGGESNARLIAGAIPQDQGHHHTHEDREDRAADDRECVSQQPAGDSQDQTQQQTRAGFFPKLHVIFSLFRSVFCLDDLIIAQDYDKIK